MTATITVLLLFVAVATAVMIMVAVAKKFPHHITHATLAVAEYPLVEYPRRHKGPVRGHLLGYDHSGRARIRLVDKPHVIVRRSHCSPSS